MIIIKRDITDNGSLNETLYSLNDKNFDVVAIADNSGTILQRYVTTPYGQTRFMNASFVNSSNTYDWEFIFQGLRTDKSTQLIYNRYRDLDPLLGRFLQRDPLGYIDGMNLYAGYHVMYDEFDPEGLDIISPQAMLGRLSREYIQSVYAINSHHYSASPAQSLRVVIHLVPDREQVVSLNGELLV